MGNFRVFIVTTFFFCSLTVLAQVNLQGFDQSDTRLSQILGLLRKPVIYDSLTVKGSPYEYNSFFYGYLYDKDKLIGNLPMRYNIYNDEFQVRIDSDNIEGITFNEDYKIEVYKSTFIPSAYDFKNKRNLKGYFILLADGSNKLLLKKRRIYMPPKPPKNSLSPGFPARFVASQYFYVLREGRNKAVMLPSNTKKFASLFPDRHQEKILSYIKSNKISLNNEDELIELFDYINQLN